MEKFIIINKKTQEKIKEFDSLIEARRKLLEYNVEDFEILDVILDEVVDYDFNPFNEIHFYINNLTNKFEIQKKAIQNLIERYDEITLIKIENYDEIGIVEYVANDEFFVEDNKIKILED